MRKKYYSRVRWYNDLGQRKEQLIPLKTDKKHTAVIRNNEVEKVQDLIAEGQNWEFGWMAEGGKPKLLRLSIEQAVEEQQQTSSNVLDADFLEENDLDDDSDLSKDELQEEITRLDIDLLAVDFLQDLLEIIEDLGEKEEEASELDGVKLEGIIAGFDQQQQVYTFVEGEILSLVRQVENTIDLELDKSGAYNIEILTAGKQISVTVNGGGENEIIINQSD